MNRLTFQRISTLRIRESNALLKAEHWPGAYYLAGYAVECALKACVAKLVKRHDFPDKKLANDAFTHNLEKLMKLAGLDADLEEDFEDNEALKSQLGNRQGLDGGGTIRTRDHRGRCAGTLFCVYGTRKRHSGLDQEAMVETILTDQLIEAGKTFVEKLAEAGLKPAAAFWFYFPESETWKLVIAEEAVATEGPRHVYERIQRKVLAKLPKEPESLSLLDITLRKPDAEIVTRVRKVVSSRPGIGGIRLTNSVVDGTFIEAAYIYRVT